MSNLLSRLLHPALFLVALVGTSAWLRHVDEVPIWGGSRHRYVHAHQDLAGFDTVFVGSSRINYALIPAVFDARMRELGLACRSLNFAISGSRGHDFVECVDWLLEQRPAPGTRFLIEVQSFDQVRRGTNWMADQDVEMHTARRLPERWSSILSAPQPWRDKVDQIYFSGMHTAANVLRIGQGPRIFDALLARWLGQPIPGSGQVAECGFYATEVGAAEPVRAAAKQFAEEEDRPKKLLAWKWDAARQAMQRGGFPLDVFLAMDRRLRAAGMVPCYVVMPTYLADFHGRDAIPEVARHAVVLDLDRPDRHPELFERGLWFDPGHYRRHGAEFITGWLAERLAELPEWRVAAESAAAAQPAIGARLRWEGEGGTSLVCEVEGLPASGEAYLLVDVVRTEIALGNGLVSWLPIPPASAVPLERREGGHAFGRFDAKELLDSRSSATILYAQAVLLAGGVPVAVSGPLSVPVRR